MPTLHTTLVPGVYSPVEDRTALYYGNRDNELFVLGYSTMKTETLPFPGAERELMARLPGLWLPRLVSFLVLVPMMRRS